MRKLSVPEYKCLMTALQAYKNLVEHMMRHHIGGYTKARKETLDLIEKLQKEMQDGIANMERLHGARPKD